MKTLETTKSLEKESLLASSARSQIYNITLYIRRPAAVPPLIPSICPSPLPPPHPTPLLSIPLFPLARGEECYPVVAGHRATRRQAIKAAEQGKDEKRRGAVK